MNRTDSLGRPHFTDVPNDWIIEEVKWALKDKNHRALGLDQVFWESILIDVIVELKPIDTLLAIIEGKPVDNQLLISNICEFAKERIGGADYDDHEAWGINPGKPFEFEGFRHGE